MKKYRSDSCYIAETQGATNWHRHCDGTRLGGDKICGCECHQKKEAEKIEKSKQEFKHNPPQK